VERVRLNNLARNATFALVLLLLAATVAEADLSTAREVREYIVFVLTTDYDYRRWLDTVRTRVGWPEPWRPLLGTGQENPPPDAPGR